MKRITIAMVFLVACSDSTTIEGEQGLPGEPGPRGQRGPQGIPGETCVPEKRWVSATYPVEPNEFAGAVAECEDDERATWGGCRFGKQPGRVMPYEMVPWGQDPFGQYCSGQNMGSELEQIDALVECTKGCE